MEEYLDTKDIQRIFKLKSPKTARALMNTTGFPVTRIGNLYRVLPSELEKWQKRNTGKEIKIECW